MTNAGRRFFFFIDVFFFSPFESIGRGKRGQITTRDHFFPTKGKKKIHFLRGEEAAEWNRPGYDLKRKKKLGWEWGEPTASCFLDFFFSFKTICWLSLQLSVKRTFIFRPIEADRGIISAKLGRRSPVLQTFDKMGNNEESGHCLFIFRRGRIRYSDDKIVYI